MFRQMTALVFMVLFSVSFAQAQDKFTTFSFASDDTHDAPVFYFSNGNIIEAKTEVNLMVDVNDDNKGGQVTFQSNFYIRGEAYDYNRIPCGNGWLHIWKVKAEGSFDHYDSTINNRLLTIGFEEAVLTSYSPSASRVGQTLTLQVGDAVDRSLFLKPDTIMIGAGVEPFELAERKDLAFTFTKARDRNFRQLIGLEGGFWVEDFTTESSFSASGSPN